MKSDTLLDYAEFKLSPERSRCELYVSRSGITEKLASGSVKPFVTQLKVAEDQVALASRSIRLEVENRKNVELWFTKATFERFVRFVSTPDVLELVSTFDAEMSQLEAARTIYSHGSSDQISSTLGGGRSSSATGADASKKELLRAIDVRLATVKQDLAMACGRAEAAGFNHDTVADLHLFAERFGATHLNQVCSKYVSLYRRRPELFNNSSWKSDVGNQAIRSSSSYTSDMSVDDNPPTTAEQPPSNISQSLKSLSSSASFPVRRGNTPIQESIVHADLNGKQKKEEGGGEADDTLPQTASRRLSVQDRINLFENKQNEVGSATGSGTKTAVTKPELRRLSSDVSHSAPPPPPVVLRRWNGASDISSDFSGDKKEDQKDAPTSAKTEVQKDQTSSTSTVQLTVSSSVKSEESVGSNQLTSTLEKTPSLTSLAKCEDDSLTGSQINSFHVGKEEQLYKSDQVNFDTSTTSPSEQDPGMMTLRAPPKKNTPPSGKLFQGGSGSRQLKGNQELNDELKMKANELEKLFAKHKLRVPGDQPNPTRQSKAFEATRLSYRNQVADPAHEQKMTYESPVPITEVDGQNHNYLLQKIFGEVEYSDDSKGKLYDSYMKKRDARLRELWDSNRAEKEARMQAMHDILEQNSSEMKAKLSLSTARRRAERLRSYNSHSTLMRDELLDFGELQDDGDLSGKKPLPIDNSSESMPRTPDAAISKSATKLASNSGRRRTQPDNSLAQSVPNFSDLRKENTKPYSAAHSQLRNYTRSRSSSEEVPSVKEEKSRRSQSLRKSALASLESSEGTQMKFSKNVEPKRFLRKNTGIGPGAGSVMAKMKASMVPEAMKNEEEYDKLSIEPNVVKDDGEEGFDTTEFKDQDVVDEAESRMSHEPEILINSVAELPASVTSTFSVQDSPGESPMSWNSRTNYPFSNIDASAESPMRSPASWNPTEADAARMRKKWGIAQKPTLAANSSGLQSRKDMTNGFKRLLKFGRKSRYTESLTDYISATTSEGDDDTEDGRDAASRSSDDLRKSRMGFSHGLPSDVNFSESDFYGDQVHKLPSSIPAPPANFRLREDHLSGSSIKAPRSFFSLSSFRSKGSDSKPR